MYLGGGLLFAFAKSYVSGVLITPPLCCSAPEEKVEGLETRLRRITRKLFSPVKEVHALSNRYLMRYCLIKQVI